MNIYLPYIATILCGALIGYVTNWIAIKMLFRPRRAHYLFGRKLPFTPGIIPKEKGRIAASIGVAISQNLMNESVLRQTLLSDEMLGKVAAAFDQGVTQLKAEERSLQEWLTRLVGKDEVEEAEIQVKHEMAATVTESLVTANLGEQIARMAVDHAIEQMHGGLMGFFHLDKLLGNLRTSAEDMLARNIDEMLATKAPAMVTDMVDQGIDKITTTPVASLLTGRDEQIASVRHTVLRLYRQLVEQRLPDMLATLDIRHIIEERINSMDVMEVERLIIEVMDKELTAIICLGILLGLIMGCMNCLWL